ncbi:unnamed protein product, partial [Adineta ricciae]
MGYLLGNEIFRHERSKQLLSITNRLGHTPSYSTIMRLQHDAAQNVRKTNDPLVVLQQKEKSSTYSQNFIFKVADNFDINPDTLYGNNSIHILNQIIVTTSENDEISIKVRDIVDDLLNETSNSHDPPSFVSTSQSTMTTSATDSSFSYKMFTDDSLFLPLLAYGITKYANDSSQSSNRFLLSVSPVRVPLMAGFFATYLGSEQRPLHTVSYLTPINEDPNSELTAEKCLDETKKLCVDTKYQKEGVLVVDEKIYRSCLKVKRRNPDLFRNIFVYAGDFHLMKNMMVVIWSIRKGSGIEDVLELIYKGATLRAIFEVHYFNKSLRCCKLFYTALHILCLEAFFSTTSSTSSTASSVKKLKDIIDNIPSEFMKDSIAQEWFQRLLDNIRQTDIANALRKWTTESAAENSTFPLWFFILHHLLEPLFELYISIRSCNFSARNAALNRFVPIFFSTNHRNYSRLCAQHLLDLQTASSYLFERISRAFAVTRSRRKFSSIALDQMIECTINKHGKGKGGITGRLNEEAIQNWTDSFAFRALASSTLHETCGIETDTNSIDSHVECSPNRKALDDGDLSMIIKKCRLVFHDDIIMNITSFYERGHDVFITFINERLITKTIPVDAPLKAMPLLKLINAENYVPDKPYSSRTTSSSSQKYQDLNTLVKMADDQIYQTIIIAQQRNLKPLADLFAHCDTHNINLKPLADLFAHCDTHNINLLNQQAKSNIIDVLSKIYPSSFYSSCPVTTQESAIDRIDIVFDSAESKKIKMFTKRHENYIEKCSYHLNGNDKLESPFSKFVHSNLAALAACVKDCWMEPELIGRLPKNRLLLVSGSDQSAIQLQNGHVPIPDYILESTQIEADTRIILHTNAISIDEQQKTVFVQASDIDVVLLSIEFSSSIILDQLILLFFNMNTKKTTYIDVKSIGNDLRRQFIDPHLLLVLHALSGCDTTSFIRNITKENLFQRFFECPTLYSPIINLLSVPPSQEAIEAAEKLLINCYSFNSAAKSLNDLRGMMASVRIKDRSRKNVSIWHDALEPNSLPPSMEHMGYEYSLDTNRFRIKWSILSEYPDDHRLETCGQCKGNCTRCKCYKNGLPCTFFCKCNQETCSNQNANNFSFNNSSHQQISKLELSTIFSQNDNEYDKLSIASVLSNVNNQSIAASGFNGTFDQSYEDVKGDCSAVNPSTVTNSTAFSHIKHDHTYCLDKDLEMVVPKRRRLSSTSSNFTSNQLLFRSPCATSSPVHPRTTNIQTQSIF